MSTKLQKYPENYIYFLRQKSNTYSKESILRDITSVGKCSRDLLYLLCSKTDITHHEILDMFDKNIISTADLLSMTELIGTVISDDIMYKKYKECMEILNSQNAQQKEKARTVLERYALVYKSKEFLGRNEEERAQRGEEFITTIGDELEVEDIVPLYGLGIIPLQTAVDWGGENIIEELASNESLKPADAKYLYEHKLLDVDTIKRLFINCPQMSYAYQFALVNAVFDEQTQEQRQYRDILEQYYHIQDEYQQKSSSKGKNRDIIKPNIKNDIQTTPKKIKMRDTGAKYRLLTSIDPDFAVEPGIVDGHIIFHYPNHGIVLIEKMNKILKSAEGQIVIIPDNQSATYVLEEEEFIKMKPELIQKGKVNRTELTQRWWTTRDPNHWIAHTGKSGWEDALSARFNISPENSRYSEEELAKFDKYRIESIQSRLVGEEK